MEPDPQRHEDYLKQRELLEERAFRQGSRYDQAVLTLAGGAFGLTVTFLNSIASDITFFTGLLLSLGWIFLVLSILFAVEAIRLSQKTLFT
ncbi:MAG: hypothetical protein ACFB20_03745 [Opitutales bacterium]